MYFNQPTEFITKLLKDISSLSEYEKHIILPDIHYKPQMEAPSSTAIATGDYIIPSLASAAINDGMSIIKLPFKKNEINDEIIKDFFTQLNIHAAKNKFDMNKYSLTEEELLDVCLNGARAVIEKFGLEKTILNSLELNGVMNEGLKKDDINRLVPKMLLKSKFSRAEFGLNFRGNHFLELQYIDKIEDKTYCFNNVQIEQNDLTIMTHLGPGPFTGNLMRLYTNREKIPFSHKYLYFFAKLYFHFLESKRDELNMNEIIKYFFKPNKYQAYNINSKLGQDFYKLIQIGTNYGYAYQLGTFTAVRDATRYIQKKYSLSKGDAKLIWNVSHNSIYKEFVDNKEQFVTRHNSVKIYNNKPTILAGSYDVPSCIGINYPNANNDLMDTHDHGIGSIISRLKKEEKINFTEEISNRYFFKRGTKIIKKIKSSNISDYEVIEFITEYFDKENIFRPWFYVKPIATLKN